tara:strand:- start:177 stop:434 length:258 start_codon:yes stop_codon:yes gene_type:complete
MFTSKQKIIDAESLDQIPEKRRASAESYVMADVLYDESDELDGTIPEGKKVGDVRIASHTRYRVTWYPEQEQEALEARIAALEGS